MVIISYWAYIMMSGSKAPDFDAYGLFRGDAIKAARAAYDALTDTQKELVIQLIVNGLVKSNELEHLKLYHRSIQ